MYEIFISLYFGVLGFWGSWREMLGSSRCSNLATEMLLATKLSLAWIGGATKSSETSGTGTATLSGGIQH